MLPNSSYPGLYVMKFFSFNFVEDHMHQLLEAFHASVKALLEKKLNVKPLVQHPAVEATDEIISIWKGIARRF